MSAALRAIRASAQFRGAPRLIPVLSDTMEPTLRRNRDFVLVAPVEGFQYEALYVLLDDGLPGSERVYRAAPDFAPGGYLRLVSDNSRYPEHRVGRAWFEANLVGIVVAEVRCAEHFNLRPAASPLRMLEAVA